MWKRCAIGAAIFGGLFSARFAAQEAAKVDFGRDVQPLLRQNCYGCHGPVQQMNGFRLDRRRDAMRGGTITMIGRGNSEASRLYLRLLSPQYGTQMPPTGALRPEQIQTIKDWIDQGAEWPDELANEAAPVRLAPLQADLMKASLSGDVASVTRLLHQGADPNVKNEVGATPLMWAVGDLEKTRLLLGRGANVNARSDDGRTPLMIAAGLFGSAPVVKLLIEKGANVNAKGPGLLGDTTPIAEAARSGDEPVFRLLLEHGADPNAAGPAVLGLSLRAQCLGCVETVLKVTPPPLLTPTMMIGSPPFGPALATPMLLARGAEAKAVDQDGNTALMLAAASDAMPVDAVNALIERGVDVNAKNARGQTALALARRHGQTPIVELLVKAGAADGPAPADPAARPAPAISVRAAVERALPLVQKTDEMFLKKSGCVSCHNNSLAALSVAAARGKGIRVDETIAQQQLKAIGAYLDMWRERAVQNVGIPGDADTVGYILLGLAAEKYAANESTDAMALFLKRQQLPSGQWLGLANRPPIESSSIQVTAVAMRALQVYAPAASRAEYQQAAARAADWLATATPHSTEDRAYQLLGLAWANRNKDLIRTAGRALVAEQRPDGGWAQIPSLGSDAYATGQALVALSSSGAMSASDLVFKKGVQFLLNTQYADGSWFVRTRAMPLQPHFESGFPYGRDQFISAAASNWATLALTSAYVKPS